MSEWKRANLRGKIHVKHGFPFKSEFFAEQGTYVVLTPGNFFEAGGFKRNAEKDKCYSSPFPPEYLLKKGALLVAMTEQAEGLLGSTAIIPSSDKFLHNQRLGLITATSDEIDLDFVHHLFKTKSVREQIRLSSTGSKVKHTSPDRIYEVEVALPPTGEQKKIASLLAALDAKIELNNQINAELEGMAKLLYDYWFVQFEFPMTAAQAATLAGKPYKSSGGKLVHDKTLNRPIPEGWSAIELRDAMKLAYGKALKKDKQAGGTIPVYGSGGVYGYHNQKLASGPGIIVGRKGSVGTIYWEADDFFVADTAYFVTPKEITSLPFLYQLLKTLKLDKMNSDSAVPGLSRERAYMIKVAQPSSVLINAYEQIVAPQDLLKAKLKKQNQELTALRDWLLPMLMNGQVTVSDTETGKAEKPAAAPKTVFAAQSYLIQFIPALLRAVNHPLPLDRLNAAVALLFLPDQLLPLVEATSGSNARAHFKSFKHPNEPGAFLTAIQFLVRAGTFTHEETEQGTVLSLKPSKMPPISSSIQTDALYLAAIIDLIPKDAVKSKLKELHSPQIKETILAM